MNRTFATGGFILALGLLWTSVPLLALGTLAQSRTSTYRSMENEAIEEILWRAEERNLKPGIGLGWSLAHNWLFVGSLATGIAWAYSVGLQAVRVASRRVPEIGQPLAIVFAILCLIGAVLLIRQGIFSLGHPTSLLSIGHVLGASGLIACCVFASVACRTEPWHIG